MSDVSVDEVRRTALDRIEQSERHHRAAFVGAAVVEASFLAGFLLLADFSDRTHVLLLLATIAIYTILAFGLFALGAHVNHNTRRVLKAIELLGSRSADDGR
ncbi:MAG: hypothetical protein H0T63_08140 [Pyrinomonadaceae bacterium]|nr:hypothetical protein [Pyrinomonadaceae bacterium]MDQ3584711.1 hypothetical protein [Acidobacteriota bacterium]